MLASHHHHHQHLSRICIRLRSSVVAIQPNTMFPLPKKLLHPSGPTRLPEVGTTYRLYRSITTTTTMTNMTMMMTMMIIIPALLPTTPQPRGELHPLHHRILLPLGHPRTKRGLLHQHPTLLLVACNGPCLYLGPARLRPVRPLGFRYDERASHCWVGRYVQSSPVRSGCW